MNKIWLYPASAERSYARLALELQREVQAEAIRSLKAKNLLRIDAEEDSFSFDLSNAFELLGLWLLGRLQVYRVRLVAISGNINQFNDKEFRALLSTVGIQVPQSQSYPRIAGSTLITNPAILKQKFGEQFDVSRFEPWTKAVLNNWVDYNLLHMKNAANAQLADIELTVRRMVHEGSNVNQIVNVLKEKGLKNENKIKLFVRDQVTKLDAKFAEERQRSLDLKQYRWRTCRDLHVRGDPDGLYPHARPSHYHRDGQVFEWNKPPEGGHPGEAIMCRCRAEMVLKK